VTPAELATLERRISVERLTPYRHATGNDLARAVALYEWNAAASAAFWVTLGHLEVLIRNAMHDQLTTWSARGFGEPRWYLDPGRVFTPEAQQDVATARRRATRQGHETPGRIVAELPLGFWRFLLASRYERTLWLPCLRQAFPNIRGRGMRRDVHAGIRDLHLLRNRIAHHEPIHNRRLSDLNDQIFTVAGWICPTTRAWISAQSQVQAVLAKRP